MSNAEYRKYLRSPKWKARRREMIAARNGRCEVCGSGYKLHLHHLTYVRLFVELDTDLAVLCDECHGAVHGKWAIFRKRVADRAVKEQRLLIEAWRKKLPSRKPIPAPEPRPPLKDLYSVKAQTKRRKASQE